MYHLGMGAKKKNVSFFDKQRIAEQRFGVTANRPQEKYPEFLRQARLINYGEKTIPVDKWVASLEWNISEIQMKEIKESPYPSGVAYDSSVKLILVQQVEQFEKMLEDLSKQKFFAVDIEGHNKFSFTGMIALWQISTEKFDYIFHPFKFIEEIRKLGRIMEDPTVIKFFHDPTNDFKCLQRDNGIIAKGIINTQLLYEDIYGIRQIKLETMIQNIFNYTDSDYDDTVTLSDWRNDPLHPIQLKYARNDSHLLWRAALTLMKMTSLEIVQHCVTKNKKLLKMYDTPFYQVTDASKDYGKVDFANLSKFRVLHEWRDIYARQCDLSPGVLMSLHNLAVLSNCQYNDEDKIMKILSNCSTYCKKANTTLVKLLRDSVVELDKIKKQICHNCFRKGHSGWCCCFAANSKRQKIYNRLDPTRNAHENRRRRLNKLKNKKAKLQKTP